MSLKKSDIKGLSVPVLLAIVLTVWTLGFGVFAGLWWVVMWGLGKPFSWGLCISAFILFNLLKGLFSGVKRD